MKRNPISNAIKSISKRDITACKKCGCPDLAWVQYKSGKWGLVHTAFERPFWRGDGPAPVGFFALKFKYHRCDEYLSGKADAERRNSACHPKADSPKEILTDAMRVITIESIHENYKQLIAGAGPLFDAMEILLKAMGEVQ